MYDFVLKPPSHNVGDMVKVQGRYGPQTVECVHPNITRPDDGTDGHAYSVTGGKLKRRSIHLSGEIQPFNLGTEELQ
jgi:hypothetical protein